ncbi:hypothetical protein VIGAN_10037300 [Vigna angularis var. angularis]|uniref:Uncharacterized protein n=1 Tax=Vigna angularis var. angularis TaxID=157739 RepID=A0A0S3T1G1_PHAAN|nr:hypothetical protein VIGAN_10037300 [Vigna angularis var. angularis]
MEPNNASRTLPRRRSLYHQNPQSQSCSYQHPKPPKPKVNAPRFEFGTRPCSERCTAARPERTRRRRESNGNEIRSTCLGKRAPATASPTKASPNADPRRSSLRIPLGFAEDAPSAKARGRG